MKEEYQRIIAKLSEEFSFPYELIATLAMNESSINPDTKPYFEKAWRYFTDSEGKPLKINKPTTAEIQAEALRILGDDEFNFQVNAHGAFQTVGSVLRQLGYKGKIPPQIFYEQGKWALTHLTNLRKQFIKKYGKEPSFEQMCGMYNGGFGAVTDSDVKDYVKSYVEKSLKNKKIVF